MKFIWPPVAKCLYLSSYELFSMFWIWRGEAQIRTQHGALVSLPHWIQFSANVGSKILFETLVTVSCYVLSSVYARSACVSTRHSLLYWRSDTFGRCRSFQPSRMFLASLRVTNTESAPVPTGAFGVFLRCSCVGCSFLRYSLTYSVRTSRMRLSSWRAAWLGYWLLPFFVYRTISGEFPFYDSHSMIL
jgi:hypothetical protein